MIAAPPDLAGLVLAGGDGRRFGRPKAGVPWAGGTLVGAAVALLAAHGMPVVVAARPHIDLPPLDVPVAMDGCSDGGPLAGIAAGIALLEHPRVLVLACDMPLAAPLVAALVAHPGPGAVVAADHTGQNPLCAIYPRERASAAIARMRASDQRRAAMLVQMLGAEVIEDRWGAMANINRPADLDLAMARRAP